jgi:hypothetical protein
MTFQLLPNAERGPHQIIIFPANTRRRHMKYNAANSGIMNRPKIRSMFAEFVFRKLTYRILPMPMWIRVLQCSSLSTETTNNELFGHSGCYLRAYMCATRAVSQQNGI